MARSSDESRFNAPRRAFLALGAGGLALLAAGGGTAAMLLRRINAIGRYPEAELARLRQGAVNPLFATYPALARRIPWRPLGRLPTPIEELPPPEGAAAGLRLFVKRDDLSSGVYGGNKVRKLEHFLAEAELAKRRTLVTLGGIGSNHALATALHGAALGFETDLVLYDQPVTPFVRRNLGGFAHAGARVHYGGSIPASFATAGRLMARRRREGAEPYFIMVGGTTPLGCIGHVSAALELAQQVEDGAMPEPDRLFIPLGTCGTAIGLLVGLRLAGLKTRVTAVRVADPISANATVVRWMAQGLADLLHEADPTLPDLRIDEADFDLLTDFYGPGYGFPTGPAEAAVRWAEPRLALETTYTGKALAACLDFARKAEPETVCLFWNTFSSARVPEPAAVEGLPGRLARIARG
ncbi:MAG TPA: pyridoxal-phosphate dependent enzyme [Longimicrobiaceae bacterium]|nr:pyridoxal-phosphate dependent enzyme [Longimicrobiaceae bacterium]